MKLKLSILLLTTAVFCQKLSQEKKKWVKDDTKCGDFRGISCTAEEIKESQDIQKNIDELESQVKAEDDQIKKDELNRKIESLENNKKCREVSFGTKKPSNGSWMKYDRETCMMTSEPCPHKNDPELADDSIFMFGGLADSSTNTFGVLTGEESGGKWENRYPNNPDKECNFANPINDDNCLCNQLGNVSPKLQGDFFAHLYKRFFDHVKDKLSEEQKNVLNELISTLEAGNDVTQELENKLKAAIPEDLANGFFKSEGEINIKF